MINQEIPKEQLEIIANALEHYRQSIEISDLEESQKAFLSFDSLTLKLLMQNCKVVVSLEEKEKETFSKYGVDFPEYIGHEPTKDEYVEELKKKISDFEDEVYYLKQDIQAYQNDLN